MENTYGLLHLQRANLRILTEIDRICKKHNIAYFLDSGTLLGAIRHGGFIPWDDDADIAMTRENYEAFKRVAKEELPTGMHLLLPTAFQKGRAFFDFTPRVIYEKSQRHLPDAESAYYEEKLNHVWVDIFILDILAKDKSGQNRARFAQKLIYLFSMGHRRRISLSKYPLPLRPAVGLFSLLGKLISMRFLFKLQNRFARSASGKDTGLLYYSNYQPDYLYVTLKKEWVSRTVDIEFEDTRLSIPEEYEEILKTVYGDYMKLPEPQNRKPSHGSLEIKIYE